MSWLEIRVAVKGEAQEAVTNFLHEAGADGLLLEANERGEETAVAYFPSGDCADTVLAKLRGYLTLLNQRGLDLSACVETRLTADKDWNEEWKKHYRPVSIGPIYVAPSWLSQTAPAGQILVRLDPGLAFGTGLHPTTQMCIGELAKRSCQKTVLDLGAGSGILAIVAAKVGAEKVVAVDNDPLALRVAGDNAALNQCRIEILRSDVIAAFTDADYDLAVANIGFSCCAQLAEIYRRRRKGVLILSGFLEERLPEFQERFGGLIAQTQRREGWVCVALEPENCND